MSTHLKFSVPLLLALLGLAGCSDKADTGGTGGTSGTNGDGGSGGTPNNCDGRGDPYVAGIAKVTTDGMLTLSIMNATPAPPEVLTDNTWELHIVDSAGAPITGAALMVRPLMVDHGHGSSKAVVTTDKGNGDYSLTPVYFQMSGYWETTITVSSANPEGSAAVFGFCLAS